MAARPPSRIYPHPRPLLILPRPPLPRLCTCAAQTLRAKVRPTPLPSAALIHDGPHACAGGSIPVTLTFADNLGVNVLLLPMGRGDDGAQYVIPPSSESLGQY